MIQHNSQSKSDSINAYQQDYQRLN